jgi:hypothetical protein
MKGEPNGRRVEQDREGSYAEGIVQIFFKVTTEVDRTLTVKAILHIFVESGKLEDVGEALAKTPEVIEASGTEGGGEREREADAILGLSKPERAGSEKGSSRGRDRWLTECSRRSISAATFSGPITAPATSSTDR